MIRGYLERFSGRRRPFVDARVSLPTLGLADDVSFLIDTGADSTVLAPTDAAYLRIPLTQLPPGLPTAGVGGRVPTLTVPAVIGLGHHSLPLTLRILAPAARRQTQALRTIPSLLGRDMLAHFALFLEERTQRVMLLEPHEVRALRFP